MEFVKVFFAKIGHLFLGIVAAFRRALCCFRKRRRSSDVALPITSIDVSSITATKFESPELQDWEVWNEGPTSIAIESTRNSGRPESKNGPEEEESVDYFQDMMPSIRRPKKFVMKTNTERSDVHTSSGNRFCVNTQGTVSHNPELGVIDDHMETWEDVATEDLWDDAESVLREQRIMEREKRLAEHQRRKQEKESKRLGKPDPSMLTKLS